MSKIIKKVIKDMGIEDAIVTNNSGLSCPCCNVKADFLLSSPIIPHFFINKDETYEDIKFRLTMLMQDLYINGSFDN
jgi:hypothetical protein